MKLFRLTKTRFLSSAWSGFGAREGGGRWNSVGTSMVYLSEAASLTMLETLVHLNAAGLLDSYTLLCIEVDEALSQTVDIARLPERWTASETPQVLTSLGDAWIAGGSSLLLRVPSAVSPVEFNYLLNPDHPQAASVISSAKVIPFKFDERLK
ncbi:RES family NAD+ phosphorylase [Enterobacteriaceae bacterium H11S18]|uniref:RES family NAD+ phosphorylase n=1 Tax=Dryocola clanedunensis TaxID=2925396 RepID=UPI0022F10BB1|nr:RES family NAD+ phosphorylase [Dryocola clanedunensis]MCT4704899.1 RES family NAD+ phosphorylase [Dryocola clanedunensis]MCT4712050.1 RES family NAD+ phosphorylase [Dryocola clanedunensis]